LIALTTLKKREKDHAMAPALTKRQHRASLANVMKETTEAKKNEAAKTNYSTCHEELIPADFDRVLLAVLHIVLGITKKLWDGLVLDIQAVDCEDNGEQQKLNT
jgi:hypothetical protein